ncbi:hypothetical protein AVEN_139281-1 [Araneus ventricosus]|uniref:Uncharacterized protein n=1 Tax=Araneus ventricosus TaxID=182803 RepID=A0A4Y2NJP2_ARAVE|nr:hypothetical protein AVEN_139281-1 [Araneus ventricosus]
MAFLAKVQKVDILSLVAEVGLDASPTAGSLELIKLVQSSAEYEQESSDFSHDPKGERTKRERKGEVKRTKVPEELWVSHLIELLPKDMV